MSRGMSLAKVYHKNIPCKKDAKSKRIVLPCRCFARLGGEITCKKVEPLKPPHRPVAVAARKRI
jgi:hypothetical protein